MSRTLDLPQQIRIAGSLLRWFAILTPVSILIGLIVALFLWLLDYATTTRENNFWLIYLLPIGGLVIHMLYTKWGRNSERGNNIILDEIHQPQNGVPLIMAPLILFTTVLTHLVGGSAGREGTAVQIGGSVASLFDNLFKLKKQDKKIILTAGMAAGFGSVFGTPLAGSIFALEVISMGKINLKLILPCLFAALVADFTTRLTGIVHTTYSINHSVPIDITSLQWIELMIKIGVAGVAFGLASLLFSHSLHLLKKEIKLRITKKYMVPVVGSFLLLLLTFVLNSADYLGLGVNGSHDGAVSIVNAFTNHNQPYLAFFWKLIFTVVTLGFGFKGGEVTPLFFIGATLGNTIARLLDMPIDLFAGIGFVAVFAGATNTPIACTLMGMELFGGNYALYLALGCFTAYYFSGHNGIYSSQKKEEKKLFYEEMEDL